MMGKARPVRIIIASRIFAPEVSAASAILRSWAEEFRVRGAKVQLLTVRPPRDLPIDDPPGITISRWPVKRDRQKYVRGYLSYLSFDIPLAFRLLFSRTADLYVVEPPPTTVAVVRVIAFLKRRPYVVRAADYWTEAAEQVTDNPLVIGPLRLVESWGLRGASMLFVAHQPLLNRFRKLGIKTPATPIGFGADTKHFRYHPQHLPDKPIFVYAGTYSEWHGADIFLPAFHGVLQVHPEARLLFYGNGEDREKLRAHASELGLEASVAFHGPIPPAHLAPVLAGATASVASLAPVPANDYVLATKVYSSLAAGCPVIFAGHGPTIDFLRDAENPNAGVAVPYDVAKLREAMLVSAASPLPPAERAKLANWSAEKYSLTRIAKEVVDSALVIAQSSGLSRTGSRSP